MNSFFNHLSCSPSQIPDSPIDYPSLAIEKWLLCTYYYLGSMINGTGQLLRWHLVFCVFYYQVQELLLDRSAASLYALLEPQNLVLTILGFFIMFTYALFPYLVLRKHYQRPWYVLTGWLVLGTVAAAGVRYGIEEVLAPVLIGFRNYPADTSLLTYYLDNLYFLVLHGALGVIVYLLQTTKLRERQRQELIVENQRTELAFLRAQINPHFLFNTLNNVYSLFFQQSDKALKVIERLTVMLRYGLYEKAEKVTLKRELEHLLNFIELEKLRLDFNPNITLNLPEGNTEVLIPPLLLITFVENAFKHGDLRQPLLINLATDGKSLSYTVTNYFGVKQKDRVGGVGLDNLRKRLVLLYGDQQELSLAPAGDVYRAHLKIKEL